MVAYYQARKPPLLFSAGVQSAVHYQPKRESISQSRYFVDNVVVPDVDEEIGSEWRAIL
jgi:hypothetical protein